jgi:hypothetical protein
MTYIELILYGLYTSFIIIQIITSSFIIYHKDEYNFTYDECKNSNNIFDIIISIATGILSTGICIFITFIMYYISCKIIDKNEEQQNLLVHRETANFMINFKEIRKNIYIKFNMILLVIFVLSVLSFIILNGIQFIYQLNNISNSCLNKINNNVIGFYPIYKLMLTISFFASYSLFFIIPASII